MPSGAIWRAPTTVAHRHGRADRHRRRAAGRRASAVDRRQAGRPAWPAGRCRFGCGRYRLVLAQRRRGSNRVLRILRSARATPHRLGAGGGGVDLGSGLGVGNSDDDE